MIFYCRFLSARGNQLGYLFWNFCNIIPHPGISTPSVRAPLKIHHDHITSCGMVSGGENIRIAVIGAVWSMLSDPSPSGSGGDSRWHRNVTSLNMRAPGGMCIDIAWHPRSRRITQALAAGRLALIAAKVTGIEPNAGGAWFAIGVAGRAKLLDCTSELSWIARGSSKTPCHHLIPSWAVCSIRAWPESIPCISASRSTQIAQSLIATGSGHAGCLPSARSRVPLSGRSSRFPAFAINAPRWPSFLFTAISRSISKEQAQHDKHLSRWAYSRRRLATRTKSSLAGSTLKFRENVLPQAIAHRTSQASRFAFFVRG